MRSTRHLRICTNSLGIGPSDDLREAYNKALSQVENDEADIGTVMDELKESSEPQGAYYCSFGVFKKMYELSARRLVRFGFTVHIALITVDLKDADRSSINRNRSIEKAMDAMRESISKSLRTGDVFAGTVKLSSLSCSRPANTRWAKR